jgi:hypothetical protein
MIRRTLANLVVVSAVASNSLAAQVRADPGTMIGGRVAVRVYVTLSDDETTYAPIGGVRLRFFRTTADTVIVVRTDDAGTATAMLLPGEYRLMSTSPVDWKGARYSWNKLITVREGLPTVELTASTAVRDATVAAAPADSAPVRGVRAREDTDRRLLEKDPGMATMLSFFPPGSGQIYAGERVKGAGLFVLSATGFAMAVNALSCAASSDCESTTGKRTLGRRRPASRSRCHVRYWSRDVRFGGHPARAHGAGGVAGELFQMSRCMSHRPSACRRQTMTYFPNPGLPAWPSRAFCARNVP